MTRNYGNRTIELMMAGSGSSRIPADSLMGELSRPIARGFPGARVGTFETLFDYYINNVPDPDTALMKNPDFAEVIRQQPDVHACMRLRELTVASLPWQVNHCQRRGIDPETAKEQADYLHDTLLNLPNLPDLFRQMQQAVLMGGRGTEWVWATDTTGRRYPVEFWDMDKSRFTYDRLGNLCLLTREAPVWGQYVSRAPHRVWKDDNIMAWICPPGRFMYHKYMAQGGTWAKPAGEGFQYWGRGEDNNLYLPVTFDMFVLRFRLKWLEKHGMPLTILYYPENNPIRSEILKIAESLRGESVVTIPKAVGPDGRNHFYDLDFVEASEAGADAFASFSDGWTKPAVEKILLGGANLLEVGETGSYGATVDQRDAGSQIIFRYDAINIETTLNLQLVPYIIWGVPKWRNTPAEFLPKFSLVPEEEKDRQEELEILMTLAQAVPVDKADFYDAAGRQPPGGDVETVFLGQTPGTMSGEGDGTFDGFPSPSGNGQSNVEFLRQAVARLSSAGKQELRQRLSSFSQKMNSKLRQGVGSGRGASPLGQGKSLLRSRRLAQRQASIGK